MIKQIILRIVSVLMLLIALPMLMWCWHLINNAALEYDYAGLGCFITGLVYTFSMVTAIVGLTFAGKPYRYGWCRAFAYIQLAAGLLLILPLNSYALITLPPLLILSILYLSLIGWRNKPDSTH